MKKILIQIYCLAATTLGVAQTISPLPQSIEITDEVSFSESNLPIVVIDTDGKRIPDAFKIRASMGILYHEDGSVNRLNDSFNHFSGYISIETRGSSSQWQAWPKEQYSLETQDADGENRNVSLLGMPEENDWILQAPYSDKSHLRNVLVYHLYRSLGRYAPRTRYCELVLNGDYRGLYVLTEKIKRDAGRVDIANLKTVDNEGDQLTGGYILKIDKWDGEENAGWETLYPFPEWTNNPIWYQYHDPRPSEITRQQKAYIGKYVSDFERLMHSGEWKSTFANYFDVDAFVDYLVISELCKNIDTWTFSTFLYKDRDSHNGKMTLGPPWDYNLAFGNADYYDAWIPDEWLLEKKITTNNNIPFWLEPLWYDRDVRIKIQNRWEALRQDQLSLKTIREFIVGQIDTIQSAIVRNFSRWEILGETIWPNPFVGDSYEEEVDYLMDWIEQRILWMDGAMDCLAGVSDSAQPPSFVLCQNYPNPFNGMTTITFSDPLQKPAVMLIRNPAGQVVLEQSVEAGKRNLRLDMRNFATGVYFYSVCIDEKLQEIHKMILIR